MYHVGLDTKWKEIRLAEDLLLQVLTQFSLRQLRCIRTTNPHWRENKCGHCGLLAIQIIVQSAFEVYSGSFYSHASQMFSSFDKYEDCGRLAVH